MAEAATIQTSIPSVIPPSGNNPALFQILVNYNDKSWTIQHRYSTFEEFHKQIRKRYGNSIRVPSFPKKHFGRNKEMSFLEKRRMELAYYLLELLKYDAVRSSRELETFLAVRSHTTSKYSQMSTEERMELRQLLLQKQQKEAEARKSTSLSPPEKDLTTRKTRISAVDYDNLEEGAEEGDEDSVKEPPKSPVQSRMTIHKAARQGNLFEVRDFLENDPYLVNAKEEEENMTPLHFAVQEKRIEVVQLLLDYGASLTSVDLAGNTPVHVACKVGDEGMLTLLCSRRCDFSLPNNSGEYPLHLVCACEVGLPVSILNLIADGGSDINSRNRDGATPLHFCAMRGRVSWIERLLQRGVDIDSQDRMGDTALHYAARHGSTKAVAFLTQAGANVAVKGSEGTALEIVQRRREQRMSNKAQRQINKTGEDHGT